MAQTITLSDGHAAVTGQIVEALTVLGIIPGPMVSGTVKLTFTNGLISTALLDDSPKMMSVAEVAGVAYTAVDAVNGSVA